MKRSLLLSAMIMLGLSFTACKKKDSDNSTYKQQVQYQLVATNTNYSVAKTSATANVQWTAGFANPSSIKFEAKQDNLKVEFTSTNKDQVDLMSSVAFNFGGFALPPGTYDEIEIKIKLDKHGPDPALQLNGQVSDGVLVLPVVVEIDEQVELKTEQHNVTIVNDESYIAVTTLDLADITAGVTANMLLNAGLTGGVIVISHDTNHDLYHIIVDNLRNKHHHCKFEHHHH